MITAKSLQSLLVSKTRLKLINIFYKDVRELFYVRQLVRQTGEEINSVRRELLNLKKAGLLLSEVRGNRLYYWANPDNNLYIDLMILSHKTTGLCSSIQKNISKVGQLKLLICTFPYLLGNTGSDDVDLIIVGDISIKEIDTLVSEEEKILGREINYMVMSKTEFKLRRSKRDPIIINFFLNYPAVLLGDPADLNSF